MNDTLTVIGAGIKKYRVKRGLTQEQLGSTCGIQKASISRFETGKINITVLTLERISSALGTTIEKLLQD